VLKRSVSMKTKSQLQQDVQEELEFDPAIDASQIGVSIKNDIVVLTGFARSYFEKSAAEQAAKRVSGVTAVANEIAVRLPGAFERDDVSIAHAALQALKWDVSVPDEKVKVSIANGWITLDGEVAFNFQREAATKAVENLTGVRGVTNRIAIKSAVRPVEVRDKIERAFKRAAHLEAERVRIDVSGDKVTLRGDVATWAEKADAAQAAWSIPGVAFVQNDIHVTGASMAAV
jgi:osmotically-inducible protein OsmY